MLDKIVLFIIIFFLIGCTNKKYQNPQIKIATNYGDIILELYPKQAPKTVAAFLQNVSINTYNNTTFYRVIKNEDLQAANNYGVIQGGVYPKLPQQNTIPHEPTSLTLVKHEDGTISMASLGAGTATTEFFICIGEQPRFNAGSIGTADKLGFAAFGKVVKGMGVVRQIQASKNVGDKIIEKVIIENIYKL